MPSTSPQDEQDWLAAYDPRAYPPVAVTVDVVALTLRQDQLHVLLVRRGAPPFQGSWALPGGFVRAGLEDLDQAAARELAEETGVDTADLHRVHLEQLGCYGAPGRDPRMHVVSVAYLAFAPDLPDPHPGTDAAAAAWVPIATLNPVVGPHRGGPDDRPTPTPPAPLTQAELPAPAEPRTSAAPPVPTELPAPADLPAPVELPAPAEPRTSAGPSASADLPASAELPALVEPCTSAEFPAPAKPPARGCASLAFDHAAILAAALDRARAKLEYTPLATAFLAPEFTISELRAVYEEIWAEKLHPGNFHRKVISAPGFVESTGRSTTRGGTRGGPRARLYRRGDASLLHPALLRPDREEDLR